MSSPQDPQELQASRLARQMQRSSLPVQAAVLSAAARPDAQVESQLGAGTPLPARLRAHFEPRLGQGLGAVRLHTGAASAASARRVGARAYTVGASVVFGDGAFQPATDAGRELIAHELVHTLQPGAQHWLRRTVNDGHDLQSARFISPARDATLEAAYDPGDRMLIAKPDTGPHVERLQRSLLAMGYVLPNHGADGQFGDETEAAVLQFQADAGAALRDGVVGPDTMALFDLHDPTRPGGVGPPARAGPAAPALPGQQPDCASHFGAVSFALSGQVATGVAKAVRFVLFTTPTGQRGLNIKGSAPVQYTPKVQITAPSAAVAQSFELGFASNCLACNLSFDFTGGAHLQTNVPTPIKDGKAMSTGDYDPVFTHGFLLPSFAASGHQVALRFGDKPQAGVFGRAADNPACAAAPNGVLRAAAQQLGFRTWVVVRHKPSGCTQGLHHVDWATDWRATVAMVGAQPVVTPVGEAITVSVGNGDGKPAFVQGGPVLNDLLSTTLSC